MKDNAGEAGERWDAAHTYIMGFPETIDAIVKRLNFPAVSNTSQKTTKVLNSEALLAVKVSKTFLISVTPHCTLCCSFQYVTELDQYQNTDKNKGNL